jgi:hypothetical protein
MIVCAALYDAGDLPYALVKTREDLIGLCRRSELETWRVLPGELRRIEDAPALEDLPKPDLAPR